MNSPRFGKAKMSLATPPATAKSLRRRAVASPRRSRSPSPLKGKNINEMIQELSARRASPKRRPASPKRSAPPKRRASPKRRRPTTGNLRPRPVPQPGRISRASDTKMALDLTKVGDMITKFGSDIGSGTKMQLQSLQNALKNALGDVQYFLGARK
jgi:hypothetical protein